MKISEYSTKNPPSGDDAFLIDGSTGTKRFPYNDFINIISNQTAGQIPIVDLSPYATKTEVNNVSNNLQKNYVLKTGMKQYVLDLVYPVGSIYITITGQDPNSFLGGTWVKIDDGYLLKNSSSLPANQLGGKTGSNSITLKAANIPSLTTGTQSANHTHTYNAVQDTVRINGANAGRVTYGTTLTARQSGEQDHAHRTHRHYCWNWSYNMSEQSSYLTDGFSSDFPDDAIQTQGVQGAALDYHVHGIPSETRNSGSNSANHTHTYTNNAQTSVSVANAAISVWMWKRTA